MPTGAKQDWRWKAKLPRPPLATLAEQREWLEQWALGARTGKRSRAEASTVRKMKTFTARVGDIETEDIVSAAVTSTYRKISRRLSDQGAVVEVSGGFRRYCDTVLMNELRRQLGRRAKKKARRLEPAETVILKLSASSRSTIPSRGVDAIRAEISYSVRAWDRLIVARQEAELGVPALRIGPRSHPQNLALVGSAKGGTVLELALQGGTIRVENPGVAPIHVSIKLLAYACDGEWNDLPRPLTLLDSSRGIGLEMGEAVFIRSQPKEIAVDDQRGDHRSGPRHLPFREFAPCTWRIAEGDPDDGVLTDVAERVRANATGPQTQRRRIGWLDPAHVSAVAVQAWVQADAVSRLQLLCRLAEWHTPGLHEPHRSGHPGGHPLGEPIRREVRDGQSAAGMSTSGNNASQARSRLARRAEAAIATAAAAVHVELTREPETTSPATHDDP